MKQEIIEEMARIAGVECGECSTCEFDKYGSRCFDYLIATELYKAGYRKPTEKTVLLSKEEYEDLIKYQSYIPEFKKVFDKMNKETTEQVFSNIIDVLKIRKERLKSFYGIAESVGVYDAIKAVENLAIQLDVKINGE